MKSSASCDDGYIDCGPLLSNRRPADARPSTARRESAPLLTKSTSACVQNSDDDLADVVPPTMYRCLSRSCSIGSQLSAAASTIHEESFSDLTLEAANSHSEYLPMSRLTVRDDNPTPVSSATQSAKRGGSKKSPPIFVPRKDVAAGSESVSLSSFRTTQPTAVPSASYRSARDDQGYLLFQPTGIVSPADDQNLGGSLERLGPPPEVPTTSSADYITPQLPPKQHTTSGMRTHSLLLNSKPQIVGRRRGSADSWGAVSGTTGPAVPLRENRDSTLSSISARPATERRGSRKPNLTVDAVASANIAYSGEL